jgi:hypothetical protein
LLDLPCPLTVWEDLVRRRAPGVGFIERWIDRVLFYDFPPRAFALGYVVFAALVALSWWLVPPAPAARCCGPASRRPGST